MSDSGKAVFLSYASQDAEAAKKICEALRSSGVEVWFDAEGGLEHGDEWDAKIRKQIKECVLFIPLISANTQAREEGYFRIEWELAAQRALGIASGVAFILPVVIDDTREPDALVPDRFRAVQWTKLHGGVMPPEVKQRFLKLWSHRAGVVKHRSKESEAESREPAVPVAVDLSARAAIGGPGIKTYAALAVGVVVLMALLGWWFTRKGETKPAAPVAVAAQEFPRDPDLKRAVKLIYSLDAIEPDFALAEDMVKPVLASRPNDPEVVTVAAMVSQEYLTRGFDTSETRRAKVQKLAERAVQLAPDDPDALATLSRYLAYIRSQLPRAEELARRAIQLRPDEPRYYRILLEIFVRTKTDAEVEAFLVQMVARFPKDALVRYDLARSYKDRNDVVAMEKALDETLALGPVAFAMVWKSWIMLDAHGDVAGMKAALDGVPDRQRTNTRVANALSTYGTISGDTAPAIKLLLDLPDTWLTDFNFSGPKSLLLGQLFAVDGRKDLARLQFESALAEINRMEAGISTDLRPRRAKMWTLFGLGRRDEAHAELLIYLESVPRPYRATLNNSWWSGPVRASLLLGERERAVALLKETAVNPTSRLLLRNAFKVDPSMAPFRDDPEIKALLAEPAQQKTEDRGPKTAAPLSPAREMAEKARDLINALETTREDFALADDLCQRALKLDPTDGEVWAVASQLDAAFSYRGWDNSPERREQMRVRAERAIRLAPDSPTAKLAQAGAWRQFRINGAEAEKLIREALEQRPDDKRAWGFLAAVLLSQGRVEESIAINDRTAAMPGGDPLGLFNKSRTLEQSDRLEEAYAAAQAAVAQKPFASALVQLMRLEINWRGDLDAAAATLARIPASALLEDRANFTTGLLHFYRRDPEAALAVWRTFPRDFFDDPMFRGPRGLLLGEAHRMAGRPEAAQFEWRMALQVVEKRLAATPGEVVFLRSKIILQAYLADPAAADTWRLWEQLAGLRFTAERPMNDPQAQVLLALGRNDEVLAQLPASIARPGRSNLTAAVLRLDPHYDPVRDDPRFRRLLEKNPRPEVKP